MGARYGIELFGYVLYPHVSLRRRPGLLTMDRAQIGGLDDVGIGALFGLADYR